MKIHGAAPAAPAARKRSVAGKSDATFEPTAAAGGTGRAAPAAGAMGVGSIDALLALQGEADAGAREQASGRAFTLLDILDDIRIALLEGGTPRAKLQALLDALSVERADTRDTGLETVLDEVETRAMVELAKHETRPG